ncbi:hypothetical protein [Streptosporangium sp. NPDC000396]|uniref:hypothetical protein n=1 Tax=Streptosporangium sp. NPDC000396 TaxID=3366185 RepID=UPI0036C2ED85
MKTAISVPDEIYSRAERCAATLGVSRSEFYTTAAQRYMNHLESQNLVDQINTAVELAADDDSAEVAVSAGRRTLALEEDDW